MSFFANRLLSRESPFDCEQTHISVQFLFSFLANLSAANKCLISKLTMCVCVCMCVYVCVCMWLSEGERENNV